MIGAVGLHATQLLAPHAPPHVVSAVRSRDGGATAKADRWPSLGHFWAVKVLPSYVEAMTEGSVHRMPVR